MVGLPEYRVWAEVDLGALGSNLRWIRFGVGGGVGVITVVKGDAYGHGLQQIAGQLMSHGTDVLGVANLEEAAGVRGVGRGWPVLMLGACGCGGEFERLCRDGVAATVSSVEEAVELSAAAGRVGCRAVAHLKVDTGMGRLGVLPEGLLGLAGRLVGLEGVVLGGVYSHLSCSEDDAAFTGEQLRVFRGCLDSLREAGIGFGLAHVLNSGGLVYEGGLVGNAVRPGLLVYGVVPPGRRVVRAGWVDRLVPVLSLKSRVSLVRVLGAGCAIGYGQREVCGERCVLAVVSAGYGDGVLRCGSGRMEVLVGGRRCRVRGVVTMDQLLVDVTCLGGRVRRGDEVVIIGSQGGERISVVEAAGWAGSIAWEVLTSITQRVPRVYRGIAV